LKNAKLEIISETPHFIVVEKIAGVNVERWDGFVTMEQLVFDYLKSQKPQATPFVGVVHRLDRAVSGVLVFAKRRGALLYLNHQFAERKIEKKYFAIVEQMPKENEAFLTNFLYSNKKERRAEVFEKPDVGILEARLKYDFVKKVEIGYLLDIQLFTGRFHQIRAQLSHIGCPIVGDEKYGAKTFFQTDSIALHAHQLAFFDPKTNEKLVFTSQNSVFNPEK
jgi:23S rRNA pseudouridine1911/1915/1917 synthase